MAVGVPDLARVTCETLVLHSEQNFYASEKSARLAAASAPGASMVTFAGTLADHITPLLDTLAEFIQPPSLPIPVAAPIHRPAQALAANSDTNLTGREIEILRLLAGGLSNREMAAQLVLSPRTVERHLENLYRKAGFRNRSEATAYAVSNGLVEQ